MGKLNKHLGGNYGSNEGCKPYKIDSLCGSPCNSKRYKGVAEKCYYTCQYLYQNSYVNDLYKGTFKRGCL